MEPENPSFLCECPCHRDLSDPGRRELLKALGLVTLSGLAAPHILVAHTTSNCNCGKPIKCPPPHVVTQPGTVILPENIPPLNIQTSNIPPWKGGNKPPIGDPGQLKWFQGQIQCVLKNGPSFGPRKDEFLPYLLIRAAAGDRGDRPVDPFWESPDIFVVPNQDAASAPPLPSTFGGLAQANGPNTLYAHVWNFGKAPVRRARVEFYWFNPSLGITQTDANLIGATWVDLANRFTLYPSWVSVSQSYGQWMSQGCHAIVRCPVTWTPPFENNGHECLVVRVFEPILDGLSSSQFDASSDRHIGQRNIAVVQAHSPAAIDLNLNLGYPISPASAEVNVAMDAPSTMAWLQLYAGSRNSGFNPTSSSVTAGFSTPILRSQPGGSPPPAIFKPRVTFHQHCEPLKVAFNANAPDLKPGDAQVLRLRHMAGGKVIGGYTVVLLKK